MTQSGNKIKIHVQISIKTIKITDIEIIYGLNPEN